MLSLERIVDDFGLPAAAAFATLFVGWLAVRLLIRLAQAAMARSRLDPTLTSFLVNLTYAVLLIAVVLAALDRLGIQTASLLTVLGAAGLAVGLALQGSLSNFAAGVMIIAFRFFRVGDAIEVGPAKGRVVSIQIFHTRLASLDNVEIILPNSMITTNTLKNYSALSSRRVELTVTLPPQTNSADARRNIVEALAADSRVLAEPAPQVDLMQVVEGKSVLAVHYWTATPAHAQAQTDLVALLADRLNLPGVSIVPGA